MDNEGMNPSHLPERLRIFWTSTFPYLTFIGLVHGILLPPTGKKNRFFTYKFVVLPLLNFPFPKPLEPKPGSLRELGEMTNEWWGTNVDKVQDTKLEWKNTRKLWLTDAREDEGQVSTFELRRQLHTDCSDPSSLERWRKHWDKL